MTVNKLQLPAKENAVQLKINEIIDNLGDGGATDVQINGTSITSSGVANILTNSAYSSSNKIATMSDVPADMVFIATYGTTTYSEVSTAYNAGKAIFVKYAGDDRLYTLGRYYSNRFYFYSFYRSGASSNLHSIESCFLSSTDNWQNSHRYICYKPDSASTIGDGTKLIYFDASGCAIVSTSSAGNSETPVYLNSGTITSTGLSIASSRFDGQWLPREARIFNSTAIQSTSYDLATYLPSDYTSQAYEIYGSLYLSSDVTTQLTVGRVSSPYVDVSSGTRTDDNFGASAGTHSNCRRAFRSFMLVMGYCYSSYLNSTKSLHRYLYCQVTGTKASSYAVVELLGYRRIGTNT